MNIQLGDQYKIAGHMLTLYEIRELGSGTLIKLKNSSEYVQGYVEVICSAEILERIVDR